MRILVTTIPFSGMKIDAPISMEALNARLLEGSKGDLVTFETAPLVDITLTRTHGGILVKGVISGTCKQDCASCGDLVGHEALAVIDWILQGESDRASHDDFLDDPGVIVYQGEHVDLEEHLQEALILSLSPFWHPPRDVKERCKLCNRDCSIRTWKVESPAEPKVAKDSFSESKTQLGELLKKAIKKG